MRLILVAVVLLFSNVINAQSQGNKKFVSSIHSYELYYPNDFEITTSKYSAIDFKAQNNNGCAIIVNYTLADNQSYIEELTAAEFENTMRQEYSNYINVTKFNKTIVNGRKAIIIYYNMKSNNTIINLINCLLYDGKYFVTITASAPSKYFENEKEGFIRTINSYRKI